MVEKTDVYFMICPFINERCHKRLDVAECFSRSEGSRLLFSNKDKSAGKPNKIKNGKQPCIDTACFVWIHFIPGYEQLHAQAFIF